MCRCTLEHRYALYVHMQLHMHTYLMNAQTVCTNKSPNSSPCYFCFFWINLMDMMSRGITTDRCKPEKNILKGHCALHRPEDSHCYKTHTHLHADTLTLRQTDTAMHLNNLDSICHKTYAIWVVLGISRGITGLVVSQSFRLLLLNPPTTTTTDESSSGGGEWYASLPAVKFLQAFWFALQHLQVSGGRFPSLWALV